MKRTAYESARRFRNSQAFVGVTLPANQIEQIKKNNQMSIDDARKYLARLNKITANNIKKFRKGS